MGGPHPPGGRARRVAPSANGNGARHALRLESELALADVPLSQAGFARVTLSATPVLIAQREEIVYAYRDRCPGCEGSFDGATLAWPVLQCTCGRRYDLVRAGRSDDGEGFAEPLPLVREGERIRVAIPVGV